MTRPPAAPDGPPLRHRLTGRTLAPAGLLAILEKCWSVETSSKWTPDNPARGQCSVTALVLMDVFGGRLLKTRVGGEWHFYNEINGAVRDFTASQFPRKIAYENKAASAAEALADTSPEQVRVLSDRLGRAILSSERT